MHVHHLTVSNVVVISHTNVRTKCIRWMVPGKSVRRPNSTCWEMTFIVASYVITAVSFIIGFWPFSDPRSTGLQFAPKGSYLTSSGQATSVQLCFHSQTTDSRNRSRQRRLSSSQHTTVIYDIIYIYLCIQQMRKIAYKNENAFNK